MDTVKIKPEHLDRVWYEDENGNKRVPDKEGDNRPLEFKYYVSNFPTQLTITYIRLYEDGEGNTYSNRIATVTSSWSPDLALAIVNSGDYTLGDAILIMAKSCERCLNVIYNHYMGPEEGYPELSEQWHKCNTKCKFCEHMEGDDND